MGLAVEALEHKAVGPAKHQRKALKSDICQLREGIMLLHVDVEQAVKVFAVVQAEPGYSPDVAYGDEGGAGWEETATG